MEFFTTIENQKRTDGSYGVLYDHFYEEENAAPAENRATSKFHTICAAAALSEIPFHEAWLLSSVRGVIDHKFWDRQENTAE